MRHSSILFQFNSETATLTVSREPNRENKKRIRTRGIREVLDGQDKADGGDHSNETPFNPAGRIRLSVTVFLS